MSEKEKKLSLLIVEDSKHDVEFMVRLLKKNNIEMTYHLIDSEEQMKSHLTEHDYDMIISDFNMPGFNGIEALKIAKNHDLILPFILISGVISQDQELDILKLGADEVILKSNLKRLPFAIRRVSHDVENKKKINKLISTKDKLISVIAHDLRGTVMGIQMLTNIIHDDIGKETEIESLKENIQLIKQSAYSTTQLLENLLNWAHIQLNSLKPSIERFPIQRCIKEAIDSNLSVAAGKKIKINFISDESIEIDGDCNMLAIVFRNLISNAIKFSKPNTSIEINVADKSDQVSVSVNDQGIGMPEEIKQKLFNPDDRPKRQGTDNEQSTGLGLLLTADAIKMHNGSINVHSEDGVGSTFTVILPKQVT